MPPKKMNKLEPMLLNYPLLEMMKRGNDEEHISVIFTFCLSGLLTFEVVYPTVVPLSLDNQA